MRALVTGAGGFVGPYLLDALRQSGAQAFECDMHALRFALDSVKPSVVFHLAAQTFVPDALRAPLETYETNTMGTARLAQAVRESGLEPAPRILFTSSAEVYGVREPSEYPLRESLDLRPANPYGASKAAAEAILLAEARSFGTDVVIARAFNHVGPGQKEHFVVASLAAQLARIAAGSPSKLLVGNLEAARDFLDVRDVVAAYIELARHGERGEIYNVCSGAAVTIRDVLGELIRVAGVAVEVREDPNRLRSAETPLSVGSPAKLRARTGWSPRIPLTRSLRDVYEAASKFALSGVEG
ncbi:MAG TPA: GDP-mannose 4,6-dehydratase [Candidatus Nitrosotalea sp.]|nr:GDP-mannose 4,6-dehydratase [Candidatus Nitrosotalea sp.]